MTNHGKCDCLDCVKQQQFESYFDRHKDYFYNSISDNAETADQFIDGTLKAIAPVKVFSRPNGEHVTIVKPGEIVGQIYSWKVDGKDVWWSIDRNGKHFGFVKNSPGFFDENFLRQSVADFKAKEAAEVKAAADARIASNPISKTLKSITELDFGDIFNAIKWVIVIVLIIVVLAIISRFVK